MSGPVSLLLEALPGRLAICRLDATSEIPAWVFEGEFYSISKTRDELSIVCLENVVPPDVRSERGWRRLMVQGQLDFSLTGILSALAKPLADKKISIFAISTFDTDHLLVRESQFEETCRILKEDGHKVIGDLL